MAACAAIAAVLVLGSFARGALRFDQGAFYCGLHYLTGAPLSVLFGGWAAKMAAVKTCFIPLKPKPLEGGPTERKYQREGFGLKKNPPKC